MNSHNINHTRPIKAKDVHLQSANELQPPSELRRWQDKAWRYVNKDETDVMRTWKRFGFVPNLRRA